MQLVRIFIIARVLWRFGLDEIAAGGIDNALLSRTIGRVRFGRDFATPRAVRLREALEALGPIFVKFGQMLSTRRDLLADDIANELAKLDTRAASVIGDPLVAKELAINGNDLLQAGFPGGKALGELLDKLLSKVHEDTSRNTRDQLLALARELA